MTERARIPLLAGLALLAAAAGMKTAPAAAQSSNVRQVLIFLPTPVRAEIRTALQLELDALRVRVRFASAPGSETGRASMQQRAAAAGVDAVFWIEGSGGLQPVVVHVVVVAGSAHRQARLRSPYDEQDPRALAAAAASLLHTPPIIVPARAVASPARIAPVAPAQPAVAGSGATPLARPAAAEQEEVPAEPTVHASVGLGFGLWRMDDADSAVSTFSANLSVAGFPIIGALHVRLGYLHAFDRWNLAVTIPNITFQLGDDNWPLYLEIGAAPLLMLGEHDPALGFNVAVGLSMHFDGPFQVGLRLLADWAWTVTQGRHIAQTAGELTGRFRF